MKQRLFKLALGLAVVFSAFGASAQQKRELGPEWGENDSIRYENYKMYSFFRESFQFKLYDEAAGYLQYLMEAAPKARPDLYGAGVLLYSTKFNVAADEAQKKVYLDSMMMIFDRWVHNFADHPKEGRPFLIRKKAIDYMELMANDREGVDRLLKEAIEADTSLQYPEIVSIYFQHLTDDYKLFETVDADQYLAEYERLSGILDASGNPEAAKQKETLDALAVNSGALDCGYLETIYGEKIDANPDDKNVYMTALSLLRRNKCDGLFFAKVMTGLHRLDPSSATALVLAASFEDRKEFATAIKYLTDALAKETDPKLKENLYIRISANYLQSGNAKAAADNARQAIAVNPESGLGYYTLALAYASGSTSCPEDFDRQTVYWLVYDNLMVARRLMANEDNYVKKIDADMASYRSSFPIKEEAFFRGMEEGAAYTVKCGWITGNTTVRTVK